MTDGIRWLGTAYAYPDADQVLGNAVVLTRETGNIEILSFTQFADPGIGAELANTHAAITSELTAAGRTATITSWRSVTARCTTQGWSRYVHSSWSPPLSVTANALRLSRLTKRK